MPSAPRLLTATLLACCQGMAAALTLYVPPTPGWIDSPDKGRTVTGPAVEILQTLAAAAQLEVRIAMAPMARGLAELQSGEPACVVGLVRTAEREPLYRWAGPITRTSTHLYARSTDSRPVLSPAELRGARIGAVRGSVQAQWLLAQDLKPVLLSDNATSLRMLRAGRLDYWAVNDLTATQASKMDGGPPVHPVYLIGSSDGYLACNAAVDDPMLAALNQAIERLTRQGAFKLTGLH